MNDIIEKINTSAASLLEQDLDVWILPEIIKYYQSRIDFKANTAYGYQTSEKNPSVAVLAFREMAKTELKTALHTYLFKLQHWKTGRDINPYLLTSLARLADRVRFDNESVKKFNIPICPLCKEDNRKEFLIQEDKLWRCEACTNKNERLIIEIKEIREKSVLSPAKIAALDVKCNLYKIFSLHSRKGYRCLDCARFIPESINTANGISCPYDGCIFFGKLTDLELMAHPVSLCQRKMVSLQTPYNSNNDNVSTSTLQDSFEANNIQADVHIDVYERNQNEYNVLMQVIEDQIDLIKRMNSPGTLFQKILMYEAYKNMVKKFPEEMVSYLVHQKQSSEFPIQSRIFQEYAGLVENFLPFSIKKKDTTIDIVDLTDPNLSLFLGVSKFDAVVKSDHSIPNNTVEVYIGGRKFKNYGPCFIGKLIDIVDKNTNTSLMKYVKDYSFVNISLQEIIPVGTLVNVTHFRIPSHYEMNSMVHLQRLRRQLVDKVFYRLNKKKREIKKKI